MYFKLPENATNFLLPENTVLDAGLDINDLEIRFKTDKDLLINRVEIGELRTTFVSSYELVTDKSLIQPLFQNLIYAAPVANSKDGVGEPLDEKVSSWPALG